MKLKNENDDNVYMTRLCCYLPKKKEKVVTLRMNQELYQTIEDYAKGKGLIPVDIITEYDDTTISIRLKEK